MGYLVGAPPAPDGPSAGNGLQVLGQATAPVSPTVAPVSTARPRSEAVGADGLAAGLRHQGGQCDDRDRLPDEADRAVGEGDVGPAGVEAVDVALEIVTVGRNRTPALVESQTPQEFVVFRG